MKNIRNRESIITLVFLGILFVGIGIGNFYLENNVYSNVKLSPGESDAGIGSYIFYIVLGLIWVVIAIAIFLKNKKRLKESDEVEHLKNEQV